MTPGVGVMPAETILPISREATGVCRFMVGNDSELRARGRHPRAAVSREIGNKQYTGMSDDTRQEREW